MLTLRKDEKLQVLLGGAVAATECPITCRYESASDPERMSMQTKDAVTNGGTAVDVLVGEGGGKKVVGFSLVNSDSSSVTVTVRFYNKNGTTRIIRKHTLLTNESLYWDQTGGWYASDANGAQKMASAAADSGNISTALATGSAGSSVASSLAAGIVVASVNSVSSQGSSMAALAPASVSSQASSAAALSPASVSSQASSVAATNPATVSSLQSGASVQSFTSTNWQVASSTVSRTKSSFAW